MNISINADDFGWDNSCTDAIMYCLENGYVQTTTIMPTGESFDYAISLVKDTSFFDKIGIHLNLTEGRPLTEWMQNNKLFCDSDGFFHNSFNRYKPLSNKDKGIVYEELKNQIEMCKKKGLKIHHLDSHHHSHTAPFITPIVRELMKEYRIEKMRIHRNMGLISPTKKTIKNMYNRIIRKNAYSDYFGSFKDFFSDNQVTEYKGFIEIMCHPDYSVQGELIDRVGDSYSDPVGDNLKAIVNRMDRVRYFSE